MFNHRASIASALRSFQIEGRMLPYHAFMARLYNWCLSLGFAPGKIMPSRAFCSDETQGFPIILITKHFGAFPFNHGRVGGIVSVDRHGPHAEHGKDLLLIHASHVGYDPVSGAFGTYRRLHTEHRDFTCACGKIDSLLDWYRDQFNYARENIRLIRHEGKPAVLIDNLLLSRARTEGLFLEVGNLVQGATREELPRPLASRSTGFVHAAAVSLIARLGEAAWPGEGSVAIDAGLAPEDFFFKRDLGPVDIVQNQLGHNLVAPMPWILTSPHPLLTAACANTLAEFDRTYRSLIQFPAMHGKNLIFLSGLNIDISPGRDDVFPLTKFVPWAAYMQMADGTRKLLEQDEVLACLEAQSADNPAQISFDAAIEEMTRLEDVAVVLPSPPPVHSA